MKATTTTPTTFERYSSRNQARQIVTVLPFPSAGRMLLCAVESIALDNHRDIPIYLVFIARRGIPRSILNRATESQGT